jgi:ubiquinone/menaquinone biosynthesis C-methylase UbiE
MKSKNDKNFVWGGQVASGVEIWDTDPVFLGEKIELKDKLKLIFYPKKFLLYRYINTAFRKYKSKNKNISEPFRILDVGCGTGAAMIDLKKMFGRSVDVVGLDVVKMQIELAKEKIKMNGINAEVEWYDGQQLPFSNKSFDAIYTSDVLGHVEDVQGWLGELNRVLKPGGVLAMFSESKLGKHAYIRNYLLKKGLNTDPHADAHISLYSKTTLREFIEASGFEIDSMYSSFWLKFLVHPDELYPALQSQKKFFVIKIINKLLYFIKKKLHPFSTAFCELYGLVEMITIGRWLESQGYIILGKKK